MVYEISVVIFLGYLSKSCFSPSNNVFFMTNFATTVERVNDNEQIFATSYQSKFCYVTLLFSSAERVSLSHIIETSIYFNISLYCVTQTDLHSTNKC